MLKAHDLGDYYRIPADVRDLNYGLYFESGEQTLTTVEEYHSNNTYQLNQAELRSMLIELRELQEDLQAEGVI